MCPQTDRQSECLSDFSVVCVLRQTPQSECLSDFAVLCVLRQTGSQDSGPWTSASSENVQPLSRGRE